LLSDPWKEGPYPTSNAVTVAHYAEDHGLLKTEGWTRFKPYASLTRNLPREALREASLESEEECAEQEDYVDEEPGSKMPADISSASRARLYVKSKIPVQQHVLDRRARKNAKSRARAAAKREHAEVIAMKPESERTEEEEEILSKYQTYRQSKNNRSRERSMEMKNEVDRILGKPERKRTRIERDFLERNLDTKQRKNLGDRMRRKRIKQEKMAASAAAVVESYGGLYMPMVLLTGTPIADRPAGVDYSYGMASINVDSSLNGTRIADRPAGGVESYGMASSSAVTSLEETPAADGAVESYGTASSTAVVSLNETHVADGVAESNGTDSASAEASLKKHPLQT
jgi:hypothetical protein